MEFTKEEIFDLTSKGFTPDQIITLVTGNNPDTIPKQSPASLESPKDPPEPGTPPEGNPKDEAPDLNATVAELTKTVGELGNTVKALQNANIDGAKGKAPEKDKSVTDHIKSFTDSF